MKLMFVVYHDVNTEARTQEILECVQRLGETYFVSYSKPLNQDNNVTTLLTGIGKRSYIRFIIDAIKYIKKINPDVLVLHDNYTAIILRWLRSYRKKIFVIYDASELYIDYNTKGLKERIAGIMQYYEQKYLKYANVTIAANIERAQIMKEYYHLSKLPLVFDNIHKISDDYNYEECKEKYHKYFKNDVFTIVYAGGIAKKRMTFELADAVGKLGNRFSLLVLGVAKKNDMNGFNSFLIKNGYKNVKYLGFIPRTDYKYFLDNCKISVSAFSQDTINNKYCASGKLYESLFQGKPILTTENPPLKRLCNEHGVGVSTSDFMQGILELENQYEMYCENVVKYINSINYDDRIEKLKIELEKEINLHFNGNEL